MPNISLCMQYRGNMSSIFSSNSSEGFRLQNYQKILKKCLIVTDSLVLNHRQLNVQICYHNIPPVKGQLTCHSPSIALLRERERNTHRVPKISISNLTSTSEASASEVEDSQGVVGLYLTCVVPHYASKILFYFPSLYKNTRCSFNEHKKTPSIACIH